MKNDTIRVKVNSLKNYLDREPLEARELAIYFYEEYLKLSKEIQFINNELIQSHDLNQEKLTIKL